MKLAKNIATVLGTGYAPMAPGTVGSIFGVILFYLFNYIFSLYNIDNRIILLFNLIILLITFFIGVWSIKMVHKEWKHDSGRIVIDEVVGVFITLVAAPLDWRYYLIGLILFRIFDIWKPFFIRKIDKMDSDWSVMLDDVLAGIYSLIVLELIIYYFPM